MQTNQQLFNAAVQTLCDETTDFFANNPDFNQLRENILGKIPDGEDEEAELVYYDRLNNLITKALAQVIDHQYRIHD
jgi:translation elongation factor EF-Ts